MKFDKKIDINLLEFVESCRFDCLEIGNTKEWILQNFPDPNDFCPEVRRMNIWVYGNLELHFSDEELVLIYSDYIGELDGGPSINLDPWILNENMDLLFTISALHERKLDFSVSHNHVVNMVKIKLTKSAVDLYFHVNHATGEYDDLSKTAITDYHLTAFGLSN